MVYNCDISAHVMCRSMCGLLTFNKEEIGNPYMYVYVCVCVYKLEGERGGNVHTRLVRSPVHLGDFTTRCTLESHNPLVQCCNRSPAFIIKAPSCGSTSHHAPPILTSNPGAYVVRRTATPINLAHISNNVLMQQQKERELLFFSFKSRHSQC